MHPGNYPFCFFFFELLPDNTTINSEVYCHQLDKLNDSLQQKRPEKINRKGVVFHQYNVRPHTSLATRQKLSQLERGCNVTPTIHSRLCTIGLLFSPITPKFFRWQNLHLKWRGQRPAETKNFMSVELCYYQKDGKRYWTRTANV